MMDESPGWLWIPHGLVWRLQDLPRWIYVVLAVLGALAGYIYAVSAGTPVKVSVFWGAVLGFLLPPLIVLGIGLVLTVGAVGGFLLVVYNVFLVPDGEGWRLPEIVRSAFTARREQPRAPVRRLSAPLMEQHVHTSLRYALRESLDQIGHPPTRTAAQMQIETFVAKGFRVLRCDYGGGDSYEFWYLQSPVRRSDFPRLPPAPIAVLHDVAIEVCPPTRAEANELWRFALASRQ